MTTNLYATSLRPGASVAGPVAQADRLPALDILRGLALLGILLMNIPGFALPNGVIGTLRQNSHTADFWTLTVISVLFEGKMRAMFSALFGAGIVLFSLRRTQTGRSAAGLFYRRMGWLVLFGLADAHLLLWFGDILYFYALGGMVAFLCWRLPARYLVLGVPLVALLNFGTVSQLRLHQVAVHQRYEQAQAAAHRGLPLTAAQQQARTEWQHIAAEWLPGPAETASQTRQLKGTYSQAAHYIRPLSWQLETSNLPQILPDVLALMLLGIALAKWGFFTGQWPRARYLKMLAWGYGLGLPAAILLFFFDLRTAHGTAAGFAYLEQHPWAWDALLYQFQRIALMLGHASVLLLLWQSQLAQGLLHRLAAVGQMAFTNYVMQSVICTLIFFGYGLNYFAELQFYQLYFVVAGVWVVQLLVSPIWLRYFLFGPLEWLWRSLTYWQLQPMRRPQQTATLLPTAAA